MEDPNSNKRAVNASNCNFKLWTVKKLKDLFVSINEFKDKQVNLIVKVRIYWNQVISTEILISKKILEENEMRLLEIIASDETGSIHIFLKDGI